MNSSIIDVNYDFTSDSAGYWDSFWDDDVLGGGLCDPDCVSTTLRSYHRLLWSKTLPNGQFLDLQFGTKSDYLLWNNYRFGSDSILASFRYKRYRYMLEQVKASNPNYTEFIENFLHKCYTIGGSIIFPKHRNSINQHRGCNPHIRDRWDLTLECIRRFYVGQKSPLYNVLMQDKDYFDLFVNFRGYVEFFLLQDCVSKDYDRVNLWLDNENFDQDPFPQSVDEYYRWMNNQLAFLELRNKRIANHIQKLNST